MGYNSNVHNIFKRVQYKVKRFYFAFKSKIVHLPVIYDCLIRHIDTHQSMTPSLWGLILNKSASEQTLPSIK